MNDSVIYCLNDSTFYCLNDSLVYAIEKIANNTAPITIRNIDTKLLAVWSFIIASASLLVGVFSVIYGRQGFRFQKKATEQLETLIPNQISYFEVVGSLINSIITLEAIYFGKKDYKEYPTRLILTMAKLPEELIKLEKYEKNQECFNQAFNLKLSWQNYNSYIDALIDYSIQSSPPKTQSLAQHLINFTKAEIAYVKRFEEFLVANGSLTKITVTEDNISFYIIDRFFEKVNLYDKIDSLDTVRTNKTIETEYWYSLAPYLPIRFNMENYLKREHDNRLSDVGGEFSSLLDYNPETILQSIRNGKYDYLGDFLELPTDSKFSGIDFSNFKECYFSYIEPLWVGYTRNELSAFLEG